MKVTIAIVPPEEEQSVQLSVHNIDDNLKRIISQLQGIDSKTAEVSSAENNPANAENNTANAANSNNNSFIYGYINDSIIVMHEPDVIMICVENSRVIIHSDKGECVSYKRLMDFDNPQFASFVRISKSAIVNLNRIVRVDPGFGGSMSVKMDDGSVEWISRRCLAGFKKRLGM
ncbi:LytTR family DNA-binding domain-containing protein [Gardnerella vaginalis]|uniref:LytTR family DNA-binding domain-containing protein n=1 Tax=Gardnerella vaginalis TaxID=2702 RepID=UPI0003533832|nr:LytTR family DNA-binding domain-containing protein [Gardnerella vaginalis]EPI41247.1 LytTr DNA-binding domain protein [Gardnerella vaginalis JCP8481B]EPI42185.1 LytTr DNA-binding domain protein [Gardnerella vaginalis JCP8481A]